MANATMTIHGGPVVPATVLGQGASRIPTAGKIRAGIKVLSRTASEQPRAREIYDQGVAAGESFEQIEKALEAFRAVSNVESVSEITKRSRGRPVFKSGALCNTKYKIKMPTTKGGWEICDIARAKDWRNFLFFMLNVIFEPIELLDYKYILSAGV